MSTVEVGIQTDESNRALCVRIREGDTDAEAVLIARLQSGLRLVANRATGGDLELSRDVCQETLVILLRRLRTTGLDDPSGLEAFAAQTARNLVIAARRKVQRQRTAADSEALACVPTHDLRSRRKKRPGGWACWFSVCWPNCRETVIGRS